MPAAAGITCPRAISQLPVEVPAPTIGLVGSGHAARVGTTRIDPLKAEATGDRERRQVTFIQAIAEDSR